MGNMRAGIHTWLGFMEVVWD